MRFTLDTVREVARLAGEADLGEISIEGSAGGHPHRLIVRPAPAASAPAYTEDDETSVLVITSDIENGETQVIEIVGEPDPTVVVVSHAVGTFHLPPHATPVGTTVRAGTVLGVVESLKVPNEVKASHAGRVEGYLVEEGQGVEYGQPLVVLNPAA